MRAEIDELARRVSALERRRESVTAAEREVLEAARELARIVRGAYSVERDARGRAGRVYYASLEAKIVEEHLAKKLRHAALMLFDEMAEP